MPRGDPPGGGETVTGCWIRPSFTCRGSATKPSGGSGHRAPTVGGSFLARPAAFRVARSRLPLLFDVVSRSPAAVAEGRYQFFRDLLPQRDHWRALRAFPGRVGYLDIETDGGNDCDCVTVIGLHDGEQLHQFVRGDNLLDFPDALENLAVLVTFFGGGLRHPRVEERVSAGAVRSASLRSLPRVLRRLGLRGGLKSIEKQLGMARSEETTGLDGWDAVRLWRQWLFGSTEARDLLSAYNAADVENMLPLAEIAFAGLVRQAELVERKRPGRRSGRRPDIGQRPSPRARELRERSGAWNSTPTRNSVPTPLPAVPPAPASEEALDEWSSASHGGPARGDGHARWRSAAAGRRREDGADARADGRRALDAAGARTRVIGVARFSEEGVRARARSRRRRDDSLRPARPRRAGRAARRAERRLHGRHEVRHDGRTRPRPGR